MAKAPRFDLTDDLRIAPFVGAGHRFIPFHSEVPGETKAPYEALQGAAFAKLIQEHVPFAELCGPARRSERKSRMMRKAFRENPNLDTRQWRREHKVARDSADPALPTLVFGVQAARGRKPLGTMIFYNVTASRLAGTISLSGMPALGWLPEGEGNRHVRYYEVLAHLLKTPLVSRRAMDVQFSSFEFAKWEDGRPLFAGDVHDVFMRRAMEDIGIRVESDGTSILSMSMS